ncbi:hypothetical protein EDB87DRAFT_1573471 [Lactarius vividus]|nr:hypothetical protein EDB87DRAFT_1573471 [Lactarius vividus]
MDTGALAELIKAKVASLIQEHLKPVVDELAAQHRMLQTHSALLKYNHNVNDYQMVRLENLRDLEQSINFKVAGALGFDPWQHPTMGTNLREPVPADPRLIPRFTPENATPTQRAEESAELIAQAGTSRATPAIHSGGENEDPMHSSVPLFGIRAPRWRTKEGLPPDIAPGLATYNGVAAPPTGKKGKRLYAKRAQKLNPKWKTFEAATAPTAPSSSSSTLDRLFELLDGPALAGPSGSGGNVATNGVTSTSSVGRTPESPGKTTVEMPRSSSSTSLASPNPFAPAPVPTPPSLKRTRTAAGLEDDNGGSRSSHRPVPVVVQPTRTNPGPQIKQEGPESGTGLEPKPKRRRRSPAPSPSPSIGLGDAAGGGWPGPGQLRRSTRVARAHAYTTTTTTTTTTTAAAIRPARRRNTTGNGKRATTKS